MMNDQLLIRRYLLGELPETDAERFEQEYFVSDDRFGEMLAAEDDLIEAFLHRKLNPGERRQFEARFLTTARGRQKITLAAALEKISGATQKTSWIRPLAIAAALTVMVIGAGMLRELVVMRHEIAQLQSERQKAHSAATPQPGDIFSIILSSGLERGSTTGTTLVLPGHAATAELWLLLLHDDYPTYTATLQSIDGHTLRAEHALASRALDGRKAVLFRIPSEILEPQTYVVTVSGEKPGVPSEPVEDFSFSVRRP
jgi:hypothetical protein